MAYAALLSAALAGAMMTGPAADRAPGVSGADPGLTTQPLILIQDPVESTPLPGGGAPAAAPGAGVGIDADLTARAGADNDMGDELTAAQRAEIIAQCDVILGNPDAYSAEAVAICDAGFED